MIIIIVVDIIIIIIVIDSIENPTRKGHRWQQPFYPAGNNTLIFPQQGQSITGHDNVDCAFSDESSNWSMN